MIETTDLGLFELRPAQLIGLLLSHRLHDPADFLAGSHTLL